METLTANFMLECIVGEELAKYVKFFRTDANKKEVFVKFRVNQHETYSETQEVKSKDFKQWLNLYYIGDKDSKFNGAYKKLMSAVRYDHTIQTVRVFKRIGYYNNNIYIDLCNDDHKIVKIGDNLDGQAWTIINENEITDPILFQRMQGMQELPEPRCGNRNLKELLGSVINVNDADLSLIMCWLLIALNPSLTCPLLFLNARKGHGKSITTKFIKSIIDPDAAGVLSPFDSSKDFNVAAASRYVLPLDNMGEIKKDFSDQLCRSVTGAGTSKRKLFTDYEYIDKQIESHVIINGIDCIPARSDLRDRCYFVSMQKLDAQSRKLDSELKQSFKDMKQEILGALLTALHGGLVSNYKPKFDFDVRMIDAATFACKCINADNDNILQISEDDFKRALASMKADTDEKEIQENALTEVLYEMALSEYEAARENDPEITEITIWKGTTKEFLKKIQKFTCDNFGKTKIKKLPENTRQLGKKIGEKSPCRPILEENGFSFEPHRQSGSGDFGWIIKFKPKQPIGEQDSTDVNEIQSKSMQQDLREDANISQVVDNQENLQSETDSDKKKFL